MNTIAKHLATAGLALGVVLGAGAALGPAQAKTFGTAEASPNAHLMSNQEITVTLGGFPPNTAVYGVQCDQRVLTTGDTGYCDVSNVAVLQTDDNGAGTGTFTVHSGADYASANGQGVCDAQNSCDLAFSTQGQQPEETQAVAPIEFGAATTTNAGPAHRTATQGKALKLAVTVSSEAEGTPTGTVVVKDGSKTLATKPLSSEGTARVRVKLAPGKHKLKVRYSGDPSFTGSRDAVTVTVKRRH